MPQLRYMTPAEISAAESLGSSAEAWSQVRVSEDFTPFQLLQSHLEGTVEIGSGARIIRSRVCNYRIGEGALIEGVTALECRRRSTFGNGVGVATMNECGGRTVRIFDRMSAQIAYLMAVYRHRPQTVAALERMVEAYAEAGASEMGSVGRNTRIVGAKFIREVRIGDEVCIDGASMLENGTVCDGAHIGVDVKAYDFIAAEKAHIDNGSIVERCFVGESCRLDKGFTAVDSLFFANSHCENGEAASIFAGPYTVSHHKSSLLIAGMFSFFNAGSGTNQSNHLFKCGAVHQAVHRRGCKFASGAYVMSPAIEGVYTMIMGRHTHHHDTSVFPFSYLLEQEGRSALLPGANLSSYGTVRDIEKWRQRDKRSAGRDLINFETWNPFVGNALAAGLDALRTLYDSNPDAQSFIYNSVHIKLTGLRRGIQRYEQALAATLGDLLARGGDGYDGRGAWIDAAGLYLARSCMEELLDAIEQDAVTTPEALTERLQAFAEHYDDYARSWALDILARRLGHTPDAAEIERAVVEGKAAQQELQRLAEADRAFDCSFDMAVGYGLDAATDDERRADFRAVRGLE